MMRVIILHKMEIIKNIVNGKKNQKFISVEIVNQLKSNILKILILILYIHHPLIKLN